MSVSNSGAWGAGHISNWGNISSRNLLDWCKSKEAKPIIMSDIGLLAYPKHCKHNTVHAVPHVCQP